MQFDTFYTPEEVAKRLKVAGGTIRNLIKKGKLFALNPVRYINNLRKMQKGR